MRVRGNICGLRKGDEWKNPGCEDRQCHLMIQCMETWLVCDPEELAAYYGQGFP